MSIGDILDAIAPCTQVQALAWLHVAACDEEASALLLDDLPRLVTALDEEA